MGGNEPDLKQTSKVALAALAVLFIGSVVFFKERLFFADFSFFAFVIANDGVLPIINQRYGEFVTQILPYLAQKLHFPLRTILMSYAACFNLIYLFVAVLLVYIFKYYKFAILMALYYFLMISTSGIVANDVSLAIALMFLFFGSIIYLGNKRVNIFFVLVPFIFLAFITISAHIIIIIPMSFLWVYMLIEKKNWPFTAPHTILLTSVLGAVIAFRYFSTVNAPQSYHGNHLNGIQKLSFQDIFDCFSTPVVRIFLLRCISNYWLAIIIFIISLVSLIINRKILLTILTLFACLGYIILMGITYPDTTFNFKDRQ